MLRPNTANIVNWVLKAKLLATWKENKACNSKNVLGAYPYNGVSQGGKLIQIITLLNKILKLSMKHRALKSNFSMYAPNQISTCIQCSL